MSKPGNTAQVHALGGMKASTTERGPEQARAWQPVWAAMPVAPRLGPSGLADPTG